MRFFVENSMAFYGHRNDPANDNKNERHNMAKSGKSTPMTVSRAAAIQSAGAKAGGGQVSKGSFSARAMSAATRGGSSGRGGKSK